jgi:aspartyl-tRNA(Asn)/glutamyl-tRNA(Gln) amidotransferase subunit B
MSTTVFAWEKEWDAVIGLEVHVQLNTKSKIFSGASTAYGADPNTQASAIDLGFPGVLPILNRAVIEKAVKFGLSIGPEKIIARTSAFDRKNYFYPDLPKGYQISQFTAPIIGRGGSLSIALPGGETKEINITQAHLEEDAGKSLHEDFHGYTGIDLNRAGIPLLEIVSEPELCSAQEAVIYLKTLHALVRYLDISDGNMQEGSFRVDANVSVRRKGAPRGTRAEIKNLNSFRFVEKAINHEIERQIDKLNRGEKIVQETRLYDSDKNETRSMRTKTTAEDYRYFPEPDLLPVVITDDFIKTIKNGLPELPKEKQRRFETDFELSHYDASILTSSKELADFFEQTLAALEGPKNAKLTANWVIVEWLGAMNRFNIEDITRSPVSPKQLGGLISRIIDETISGKIAKTIFEALWAGATDADTVIAEKGLRQVTDITVIEQLIEEVLNQSTQQVKDYLDGKDRLFGFFIGQIMKISHGKANPDQVNKLLKEKLESRRSGGIDRNNLEPYG